MMDASEIQRPCICGNRNIDQYRCYQIKGDERLCGALCKCCGKEWLAEKYCTANINEDIFMMIEREKLYVRPKLKANTVITSQDVQVGDHIKWTELHQQEKLSFDAIVESVSEDNKLVSVIMLQKLSFCEFTIGRMLIDLSKVANLQIAYYGSMCDPPELVVARALSFCKEETGTCNMFTVKSKVFASYCKCGPGHGWRAMWMAGSEVTQALKGLLGSSWVTGREEDCLNVIEQSHTKTKIKTGIIFVMDGSAIAFELEDFIQDHKVAASRESYLDSFIKRFVDVLRERDFKISGAVASGTSGGGIGCFEVPKIEVMMSFFLGSVVKGLVLRAPQKAVGSSMGRIFGQVIHLSVKRDDEEVLLGDIREGDQVVLPGNFCHPRCHAIVVAVNTKTRKLKLIRSTYDRGVVEEWVEVMPPFSVSHTVMSK